MKTLLFIWLSCAAINFAYQGIQANPLWITAAERSYFQAVALVGVAIMSRDRGTTKLHSL